LGKGLQALIPTMPREGTGHGDLAEEGSIKEIPVSKIKENRNQPRHTFDQEKLKELALSIAEHGVVQPIIVRKTSDEKYELVAGERRWRACIIAGIKNIPAVIKKLTDAETREIALIENIQREDLNPLEEALAYKTLMDEHGLTQDDLSRRVGKSRPFIANSVRLLVLPGEVKEMLVGGKLTPGHARALLSLTKDSEMVSLAGTVVKRGMSVRQTENAVREMLTRKEKEKTKNEQVSIKIDPVIKELEDRLKERFSTKVSIRHGKNRGKIEIDYFSEDELQRIMDTLLGKVEI